MKPSHQTIPWMLYVASSLITACQGAVSSSIDFSPMFATVAGLPDIINCDTLLPLPTTEGVTATWRSNDVAIESNTVIYDSPLETKNISLTLEIAMNGQSEERSFITTLRSAWDAPLLDKTPQLKITLDGNKRESDIFYEDYLRGSARLMAEENGTLTSYNDPLPLGIKLRGHSTRWMPKRPYRMRFDTNTSIFGMKAAKNYILLANYSDKSLIRNALMMRFAMHLSDQLYPLDYRFIDLYINGAYLGNYLLTERVEFHPNRLNVPVDLTKLDAGYLVELDFQVDVMGLPNEGLDWFRLSGVPYVVKEPETTDPNYTEEHTSYIADYFSDVSRALIAKSGYEDVIDVDNWIDYFLVQELAKNVDVGWGSVYLVKEQGGKLKHMPLWDFDLAFGNADYIDYGPEGFWGFQTYNKNNFFTLMMKISSIKQRFKLRLQYVQQMVLPMILSWVEDQRIALASMAEDNFERWPILDQYVWPNPPEIAYANYETQLDYIVDYLTDRTAWMLDHL